MNNIHKPVALTEIQKTKYVRRGTEDVYICTDMSFCGTAVNITLVSETGGVWTGSVARYYQEFRKI